MSALDWLGWNWVATGSALAFYGFVAAMLHPGLRRWAGEALSLPYPSNRQEIAALDAYRGFAASLVTLAHIWVFAQPTFNTTQVQWFQALAVAGNKAVPMFVMLSGFLIYRAVRVIATAEDLSRYAKRRFLRIYPVYLFTLLLGYLVGQACVDLPNLLSQVFMLRSVYPVHLKFVNPPVWSLFVEMMFYAVLPLWVAVFRERVLLAATVGFGVLVFVDPLASRELWLWKYFFVGIFVAELVRLHGERVSPAVAVGSFLAGCGLLAADMLSAIQGGPFDWFWRLGLVPKNPAEYTVGLAFACSLILLGTLRSSRIAALMSVKPLRVLGAVSYSLFLLHPFFILAVFPRFDFAKAGQVQPLLDTALLAPPWFAPFVMFPGALAWAIACFLLVERPFLLRRPA